MKKILFILSLFILSSSSLLAQEDGDEKIRDKMTEYIQQRMKLSKDEAEKFTPVFIRYFKEWRTTLKENRGDRLILQQKVVELRLRYRTEFKDIVGEKRSNQIFQQQDKFIDDLRLIRKERLERPGGKTRLRSLQQQ